MADTRKPYEAPEAYEVNRFHERADVDSGDLSFHHTLGNAPGQAASGAATHGRLNAVEEAITAIENRHNWYNTYLYAGRASAASNANNGAWTTVSGYNTAFNGFSAINVHDAEEGNPAAYALGLITASVDCWLEASLYVEMANNSTGRRGARITRGTVDSANEADALFHASLSAGPMRVAAHFNGPLAAGQHVALQVYQDSGAALSMTWKQLSFKAKAL